MILNQYRRVVVANVMQNFNYGESYSLATHKPGNNGSKITVFGMINGSTAMSSGTAKEKNGLVF